MSLKIIILMWFLTIFTYFLIRGSTSVLKICFNNFSQKSVNITLFKKIANLKFFTKPGYIVKRFVKDDKYLPKLQAAGNIMTMKEFLSVKQFIVSICEIYFWLFVILGGWQNFTDFVLLLLAFVFAFFIPDLYIQIKKEKRQELLQSDVHYFIDMLAITLDTGMNIERALEYVTTNMKGALAKEVKTKLNGFNYGLSLEKILDDLYNYIPVDEFKRFISSIKQAKQLGVSLSKTLEIQSQLIQSHKLQKAEELSRTASVKISIPLVLFIFPALLIIYIGPAILKFLI